MNTIQKTMIFAAVFSLFPIAAVAEAPAGEWARARVTHGLLKPLRKKDDERSRFSRVIQPPRERKLRVLSSTVSYDEKGRAFVPYAIDTQYGGTWREDISGCVYRKTGQIFVRLDDEYRPAEFLLGKDVPPVPNVCGARKAPEPRS